MARQGTASPPRAPVLEINPGHPLIRALGARAVAAPADPIVADVAELLLGQARILDGERPDDPTDFARRVDGLLLALLARPAAG